MAFLTHVEFAARCGMTSGNLTNYKARGKCRMSGDYYDDTDLLNQLFISKQQHNITLKKQGISVARGIRGKKKEKPKAEKGFVKPPNPVAPPTPHFKPERTIAPRETNDSSGEAGLQIEKMQADIARIKSVEELNRLKIQKQQGELLPTELVKPVIAQLSMAMSTAFKSSADGLIVEIAHRAKLSGADIAELRRKLTDVTNQAVKDAVAESKRAAKRLSEEFMLVRGVGERE